LLIPTFIHGLVASLRIVDRGTEGFDRSFKGIAVGFLIGVILMIISCFVFIHWGDGLIFIGSILAFIYIFVNTYLYVRDGYTMKPILVIINQILAVICVLFAGVWSIFDPNVDTFEGVTISIAVCLAFIWFISIFNLVKDSTEMETMPLFFSRTVIPIYKFNP
jgi:hypothetical protein